MTSTESNQNRLNFSSNSSKIWRISLHFFQVAAFWGEGKGGGVKLEVLSSL